MNEQNRKVKRRGENQSSSTKWATKLVCDALELMREGRHEEAKGVLHEALCELPDIRTTEQRVAVFMVKSARTAYLVEEL